MIQLRCSEILSCLTLILLLTHQCLSCHMVYRQSSCYQKDTLCDIEEPLNFGLLDVAVIVNVLSRLLCTSDSSKKNGTKFTAP